MNAVLPDILSDSILTDWPAPTVNDSVVLNIRFSSVPCVLPSAVEDPLDFAFIDDAIIEWKNRNTIAVIVDSDVVFEEFQNQYNSLSCFDL